MIRNQRLATTYFILFSLLLIGVIYAILQANLQINGTARITQNTWDIHFENIVVNPDSVSIGTGDSAAIIDPNNNCKIDFSVTLSLPGDFYEFTVDVVNEGTIDAMIGTLDKTLKINNEVISETPNYLEYTVTYSDGVEIEKNHKIDAGTAETYRVRLEFKTDIDAEDLPETTTITTSLEPRYQQADSSSVIRPQLLYDVLKNEAASGSGFVREYTGQHKDSFIENGTEKIYHWYSSNDTDGYNIQNKNNIIFANFCWQILRTTDTGGIKIIYNGTPDNNKCNRTTGRSISCQSSFNSPDASLANVGYMYNPDTVALTKQEAPAESSVFGENINYNSLENTYYLTNIVSSYDNNHHYTCNNATGNCNVVRYYYYNNGVPFNYYVELNDGRNIEQAINDMLFADNVNQVNSTIKSGIDSWYHNNMLPYTNKLEDVIYCNNRNLGNLYSSGWNPSGGSDNWLYFFSNQTSNNLNCSNNTDQFSIHNEKAKLTYPVGLITLPETNIINNTKSIVINEGFWTMTPAMVEYNNNKNYYIYKYGQQYNSSVSGSWCTRPVVSLKPGTKYTFGDGSKDNPYIIN